MYVQRETLVANPGWQKALEERAAQILEIQKRSPGFYSAVHLRYLGDLASYVVIRVWDSAESVTKFATGPEFRALGASRQPQVYAAPAGMTFYDIAHQESPRGRPAYALCEEIDLHHGTGRAWEEHEKSVYAIYAEAAGHLGLHNLRYLGDPDHYIRVSYWESQEAIDAHFASQSSKVWLAALPEHFLHNPVRRLLYQVVNYANMHE